jgi:hypothetical protein
MKQVDHQYYQERLSAYADNELSPAERMQLEDHLADCADCRKRLDDLRNLEAFVRNESALNDSEYWEKEAQKIEAALPERAEIVDLGRIRKHHSAFWWKAPAIAASILIVGYIGWRQSDFLKDHILVKPDAAPSMQTPAPAPRVEPPADTAARFEEPKIESEPDQAKPTEAPKKLERPKSETTPAREAVLEKQAPTTDVMKTVTLPPEVSPSPAVDSFVSGQEEKSDQANYIQRSRKQSATVATEDAESGTDERLDSTLLSASAETLKASADLSIFRARRDSLELALAELKKTKTPSTWSGTPQSFAGGAESEKDIASMIAKGDEKEIRIKTEQGETALVEAWFQICRLSDDRDEVDRGLAYLKGVASKGSDRNRTLADQYLKDLGKQ